MRYTDVQKLPYPATRREAANAPLATELLARAVDRKLTTLDASWGAQLYKPTVIFGPSSNVTGIGANQDWTIFWSGTAIREVGGSFSPYQVPKAAAGFPGWYHVVMSAELECEGAVTSGSHRKLWVEIGDPDPALDVVVTERFEVQNFQSAGGAVNLNLDFVTRFGYGENVRIKVNHGNTGSTLRINTTRTQVAMTMIAGDI